MNQELFRFGKINRGKTAKQDIPDENKKYSGGQTFSSEAAIRRDRQEIKSSLSMKIHAVHDFVKCRFIIFTVQKK